MTSRLLVLALVLAVPASVWAENLVLGFDANVGWDDNVFFRTDDEEDALPYRLSPWLELRRERGDLTYDLNFRVIYEDYFDQSGADTVDEILRLRGSYHASETTQLTFSEQFARVQSLSQRLETQDPATDVVPDIENRRSRSVWNEASIGVRHALSRRWTVNANVSDTFYDFQDDDLVDSNSVNVNTSLVYSLSPRNQVGFGLGAARSDFESTNVRPGSDTKVYRGFGSWTHLFSPTFTMSLQAGPTWIRTSSDAGPSDSRFTYFGSGTLTKQWETVSARLGYTRSDSTASGFSGSTVLDTVSGSVVWRPSPRWDLAFIASWARRESATTQFATEFFRLPSPPNPPNSILAVRRQIDSDDTVDTMRFEVRGERRITRYLSVFGKLNWLQQDRDVSSFTDSSTSQDRFQVVVGVRWQTEPFFF